MNLEMEMINREYRAREEGLSEGFAKGKEFTAMNLLQMNMTLEQIHQATELPMKRILELEKEIHDK